MRDCVLPVCARAAINTFPLMDGWGISTVICLLGLNVSFGNVLLYLNSWEGDRVQEQGETDSPEMCVCVCVSAPQDSNHLQDKKVKKTRQKTSSQGSYIQCKGALGGLGGLFFPDIEKSISKFIWHGKRKRKKKHVSVLRHHLLQCLHHSVREGSILMPGTALHWPHIASLPLTEPPWGQP